MVFHWSLSDSKSPKVSRTLLNTLADLSDAVVWTVLLLLLLLFNLCEFFTLVLLDCLSMKSQRQ